MTYLINSNSENKPWTKEETIVAFNVFCKIPFKKSSQHHPLIKEYAALLGRTAAALNMKVGNLGRLDPTLKAQGIVGLRHGAKLEEEVWHYFMSNPDEMAIKSEEIIARLREQNNQPSEEYDILKMPKGEERYATTKQRIGQTFFREVVLSSYNNCCCVSGICNTQLLEACHILDWSKNTENRTNPQNGLCLNTFFHRAYDTFLFAVTPDYDIVFSDELIDKTKKEETRAYLIGLGGKKIMMPGHFLPNRDFLAEHYNEFLKNQ